MNPGITALVVAAGSGRRMGLSSGRKQYLTLAGKPILAHTLAVFQQSPSIAEIVVVVGEEDTHYCRREIIERYHLSKVGKIVAGGKERQDSVYNGLKAVSPKTEIVLIHDGVRPLLSERLIYDVSEAVKVHRAAVAAVPVKNTIKVVAEDGFIQYTPERHSLWAVQTPQGFCYPLIMQAYLQVKEKGARVTDDAMLVESLGVRVKIVPGDYANIKITTPEDLDIATALWKGREGECGLD